MATGVQHFRGLSNYDLESSINGFVTEYNAFVRRKQVIRQQMQRLDGGLDAAVMRTRRLLLDEEVKVNNRIVELRSHIKMARKERESRIRRTLGVSAAW